MSQFAADVPDVIVKPGKMLGQWSPRGKVLVLLLCMALYMYLLLLVKTLYLKNTRLDRIAVMAADTQKMIHQLQQMDQSLGAELELLKTLHGEY